MVKINYSFLMSEISHKRPIFVSGKSYNLNLLSLFGFLFLFYRGNRVPSKFLNSHVGNPRKKGETHIYPIVLL